MSPVRVASVDAHPCSSLVVQTDKRDYFIGEPVNITFTFIPLLPGCMEPMIAHDYFVQIEVLTVSNQTAYSSSNVTAGALTVSSIWIPTTAGEYAIIASAYFRLLSDESLMTKTLQASTTIRVHDPSQQIPEFGLMAIGVLIVVAALGILFFNRRRKSNLKTT
jgi:hypothetical protein